MLRETILTLHHKADSYNWVVGQFVMKQSNGLSALAKLTHYLQLKFPNCNATLTFFIVSDIHLRRAQR